VGELGSLFAIWCCRKSVNSHRFMLNWSDILLERFQTFCIENFIKWNGVKFSKDGILFSIEIYASFLNPQQFNWQNRWYFASFFSFKILPDIQPLKSYVTLVINILTCEDWYYVIYIVITVTKYMLIFYFMSMYDLYYVLSQPVDDKFVNSENVQHPTFKRLKKGLPRHDDAKSPSLNKSKKR